MLNTKYICFNFSNVNDASVALEKNTTPFVINAIEAPSKWPLTCTMMNVENLNRASKISFLELREMELSLRFIVAVSTSRPIISLGVPKDRIYGFL